MKLLFAIVAAFCISFTASATQAGGGPENVLLLVNTNSEASKTIANHYINWRQIPGINVLYLDWKGSPGSSGANAFRDGILLPALLALDERRLTAQIDYLVYSSDFPWRIELQELCPDHKFPPEFGPRHRSTEPPT